MLLLVNKLAILVCLLHYFVVGYTQSNHFRHLTINDGLSQHTVNCIYQDSRGFIWMGTQDGLNRYDGYEFITFRHDRADSTSLSHSWIWDIFEDSNGDLWVATWRGLNKYNAHRNVFTRYLMDQGNPNSITGNRPTSICEDNAGNLWIGTWGGGLNRLHLVTGEFEHFRHLKDDPSSLASDFIRTLYLDKEVLWIGTWGGLSKLAINGATGQRKFKHFYAPEVGSNQITAITGDHAGNIWIGTLGGGLNRYNKANGTITTYFHDKNKNSISDNNIASLLMDTNGSLWIGTVSHGIDVLSISTNAVRFSHIQHDPDDAQGLLGNHVTCIFKDRSGLIWIGAGGLNIYNSRLLNFHHFKHLTKEKNSLNHNKVTTFFEDSSNDIWIGTETGGLNRFNPSEGSFQLFQYQLGLPNGLSSNNISSVIEDRNRHLWIGTRGGGLNKFDRAKGEFVQFKELPDIADTEGLNYINALSYDANDILWIATFNKGLIKFDLKLKKYTRYRNIPNDSTSLSGDYLLYIYNKGQYLWLGSWGGGLSRMNKHTGVFKQYLSHPDLPASLSDNIVHSIFHTSEDGKETLWVGTSGGLSAMDRTNKDGVFRNYTMKHGLPSNVIYSILDDDKGNLWISTNFGICRLNPSTGEVKRYFQFNGLQSNEFTGGAGLKLKSGELLFGGTNGFNIFWPDSIQESKFSPGIEITSFKVFNQPFFDHVFMPDCDTIRLTHKQNFFSFEFASLDFSYPINNRYKYKMEGIDKNWVELIGRRYVSYTNLSPGEYTFRVRGTNSDGVWSQNEASMLIVISPSFWQSVWFKLILLVVLIGILLSLHLYKLKRSIEMERLRVNIASDLHDEVGSTLTRISIHSEQIQNTDDKNVILDASRKIGKISREVIDTMSDIVWSIDTRNDTMANLLDRMYDFAYSSLSLRDIAISFSEKNIDKNKKIKVDCRQNIYYIFKEALTNIVKYAQASEVHIALKNDERHFFMEIKDDGRGFDKSKVSKGNGIKNMYMRARRIGGSLYIESNAGTKILLTTNKL